MNFNERSIHLGTSACNPNETRISLLEHHWWSHVILLYHPFIEPPNTICLPSTPWNDYGRPTHFQYHLIAFGSAVRGI